MDYVIPKKARPFEEFDEDPTDTICTVFLENMELLKLFLLELELLELIFSKWKYLI